jgi:hypothetical protein
LLYAVEKNPKMGKNVQSMQHTRSKANNNNKYSPSTKSLTEIEALQLAVSFLVPGGFPATIGDKFDPC